MPRKNNHLQDPGHVAIIKKILGAAKVPDLQWLAADKDIPPAGRAFVMQELQSRPDYKGG